MRQAVKGEHYNEIIDKFIRGMTLLCPLLILTKIKTTIKIQRKGGLREFNYTHLAKEFSNSLQKLLKKK